MAPGPHGQINLAPGLFAPLADNGLPEVVASQGAQVCTAPKGIHDAVWLAVAVVLARRAREAGPREPCDKAFFVSTPRGAHLSVYCGTPRAHTWPGGCVSAALPLGAFDHAQQVLTMGTAVSMYQNERNQRN